MLTTYLQRLDDSFAGTARESELITHGLDAESFNRRPSPDRWSVGECFGHLNVAGFLLLPALRESIEMARSRGMISDREPRYTFLERWFIRANSAEPRRRRRSPVMYRPSVTHTIDVTIPRFIELQDELRRAVADASGLDLHRARATSPVSRFVTMGIGAWFEATDAHQHRHLRQARKVLDDAGTPAAPW